MALSRPTSARAELSWSGWGDPAQAFPLPDDLRRLLRDGLGVEAGRLAPATIGELALTEVRMPAATRSRLESVVGADQVHSDHEARARHALGKSTLDLLRLRAGERLPAPDAVATPASHQEVLALLRVCSEDAVAVVPFGGGTSVVGGLNPRDRRIHRRRRHRSATDERPAEAR